jgi:hypothetical protein
MWKYFPATGWNQKWSVARTVSVEFSVFEMLTGELRTHWTFAVGFFGVLGQRSSLRTSHD